ncbi:MAG: hypothetical protein ACR2MA_00460 [Egibacteraceae bacterium]
MTPESSTLRRRSSDELGGGLHEILTSPTDHGTIEMIVSRPYVDARHVLDVGTFTRSDGLVGDNWPTRGSSGSADGSALLDAHLTLINRRFLDLISDGDRSAGRSPATR